MKIFLHIFSASNYNVQCDEWPSQIKLVCVQKLIKAADTAHI